MVNDGGSFFPAHNYIIPKDLEDRHVAKLGMTQGVSVRVWLAGMAMQGLVGKVAWDSEMQSISRRSFQMADAMIERMGVADAKE